MKFEWNENKRINNIRKHGIDFIDSSKIFSGETVTIEDDRYDYDEQRFITLGLLDHHVVVIAHTEREDSIRIISIRKAAKNEANQYFEQITN